MRALQDFLSTDYGLMSAAVIVFTLGMAQNRSCRLMDATRPVKIE